MEWLDTIKAQLPMDKISQLLSQAKGTYHTKTTKVYPGLTEAKQIVKRAHFLLSENDNMTLGKQVIFTREIANEKGEKKTVSYTVDFTDKDQIKRLRNFLTELVDLTTDDASNDKKETIPGFLDYIAKASL